MATGALLPNVEDERRQEWLLCQSKVLEWNRGVVMSIVVQGIDEQATESIDSIRQIFSFGEEQGGAHHLFDQIPQPNLNSNF